MQIHKGFCTIAVRRKLENGYSDWEELVRFKGNLLTNGGRDWMHQQNYINGSPGTRGSGFIALSTNSGGANASHTTLPSEITTGGLERVDAAVKTHTVGTNTSVIENTFIASQAFVGVQLSGLLNALVGGIMSHENTFIATDLSISDELRVTWTLTLG